MKTFNWPLNDNNFTFFDRLKICAFFLNPNNRWTQDKRVMEYERSWERYTGAKHCVMVSSGSTANLLIAETIKNKTTKRKVVVPAVTWQTSVSPWILLGFEPIFCDISLKDFSMSMRGLRAIIEKEGDNIAAVFPTSLVGITPNIPEYQKICEKNNIFFAIDNCENSFGMYDKKHCCAYALSSTSLYFGHLTTTGFEGGLIFTNDTDEYESLLLRRNHGMVRSLVPYLGIKRAARLHNPEVDFCFDFATLGSNYRASDIAAFLGGLDFAKKDAYIAKRQKLFDLFINNLSDDKFFNHSPDPKSFNVSFCLPIICRDKKHLEEIKLLLREKGIEYRSFISGNLLRHSCYRKYQDEQMFNANFLHDNAIYIGLNHKVKEKQILELCKDLNNIRYD